MPHQHTITNLTHRASSISTVSKHYTVWIITDPGSQKCVIMSWESIRTISFGAGISNAQIPEWGQHSSNCQMPCLIGSVGIFPVIWNQLNGNPGAPVWCLADTFSDISHSEIPLPGMQIASKIGQVSYLRWINNFHNHRSGSMQMVYIPPPIAWIDCAEYQKAFQVSKAHQIKFDMHQQWDISEKK